MKYILLFFVLMMSVPCAYWIIESDTTLSIIAGASFFLGFIGLWITIIIWLSINIQT